MNGEVQQVSVAQLAQLLDETRRMATALELSALLAFIERIAKRPIPLDSAVAAEAAKKDLSLVALATLAADRRFNQIILADDER